MRGKGDETNTAEVSCLPDLQNNGAILDIGMAQAKAGK